MNQWLLRLNHAKNFWLSVSYMSYITIAVAVKPFNQMTNFWAQFHEHEQGSNSEQTPQNKNLKTLGGAYRGRNSVTIQRRCGDVTAPMKSRMLGWRSFFIRDTLTYEWMVSVQLRIQTFKWKSQDLKLTKGFTTTSRINSKQNIYHLSAYYF